jgi:hypothetical protein
MHNVKDIEFEISAVFGIIGIVFWVTFNYGIICDGIWLKIIEMTHLINL